MLGVLKQALGGVSVSSTVAAMRNKRLQAETRTPIGIDVGSRAVKAVQFGRARWGDGKWRVVAVAEVPRSEMSGSTAPRAAGAAAQGSSGGQAPPAGSPHALKPEDVRRLLGTLERQGFSGTEVVLAVPTERMTTNVLELPPRSSQAPLEQIARMEVARAHRCAPDSFEMGSWDLPAASRATKTTPVMAVACNHAEAGALLDPFEAEGLHVTALDVRPCALARACEPLLGGRGTITAIVDVGWSGATLTLMYQGVVIYGRTLADGGIAKLYQTLGARLRLEPDVIDYLLAESGMGDPGAAGVAPQRKGPVDAATLIAAHFDAAVRELQVSLSYAQHQYTGTSVSRLLLVGGGACIRGVAAHFSNVLRIETRTAAPADIADCSGGAVGLSGSPALTLATGLAQFPEAGQR
jgi:Tfp pilus assembly PilM family ATPase